MDDLQEAVRKKFQHLSTGKLIERMNAAPDFGYDDESIELRRRLALQGKRWRWNKHDRIEIIDAAESVSGHAK